jgi:hypothetical protein
MKNNKTRRDDYSWSHDWWPDVALEQDDTRAWLSQFRIPLRKRRRENCTEQVRRLRDNEDWDDDRMNKLRRASTSHKRARRDRKRFSDDGE